MSIERREHTKIKKALCNYMLKELEIDPENEEIGWYVDREFLHYYCWRFELDGEEFNLRYDRITGDIERMD